MPMGRPGKPSPLEARARRDQRSLGGYGTLIVIGVGLVFVGLVVWAILD